MMAGGESATMHRAHHNKRRGVLGHPPKHSNKIMMVT